MTLSPEEFARQALNVAARSVLLDALTALQDHRDAVVLVGAQAVYQHSSDADLGVAAYTSDGDLTIDPERLGDDPLIEQAMADAGFTRIHDVREPQPGMWWKSAEVDTKSTLIEVDLMVPGELAPTSSRRSVSLPPHDRQALRRVDGLAVAMVDNAVKTITALDAHDSRSIDVKVAGVASLLIAKSIKLSERIDAPEHRQSDKDAADVIRLMTAARPNDVAMTFRKLLADERVSAATVEGLTQLRRLFGEERSAGVLLAERALQGSPAAARVGALAPAFVARLPEATQRIDMEAQLQQAQETHLVVQERRAEHERDQQDMSRQDEHDQAMKRSTDNSRDQDVSGPDGQ